MRVLSEKERLESPRAPRPSASPALDGLERLHLVMGRQCNARCVMCYQTDHGAQGNMPASLYVDRLAAAYPQVRSVKIQGGEPTAMRNCRELAGILRRFPGIGISLSTNGIGLDAFWQQTLLANGDRVDVSLNAASERAYRRIVLRGNWRRAVENVRALTRARRGGRPAVAVSLVVLAQNVLELHDFVLLAHDLGVDAVKIAVDPVLSFANLPPRAEIGAELARVEQARERTGMPVHGLKSFGRRFGMKSAERSAGRRRCREPFRSLVVSENGDVRACVGTWQVLGNLHHTSLEHIWNGPAAQQLRARIATGDHSRCEPYCPENPSPSRAALLHKYAAYGRRDPAFLARKLAVKAWQWMRVRREAGEPLPAPGSVEERSAEPVVATAPGDLS